MDELTGKFYAENANEIFERYHKADSGVETYFGEAFPRPMRILDIGAGAGRDMLRLMERGHDVFGVEPCEELRKLAIDRFPELDGRLFAGALPDLDLESLSRRGKAIGLAKHAKGIFGKCCGECGKGIGSSGGSFGGVLCTAVLMHVPKNALEGSTDKIASVLVLGGRALVSIPARRDDVGPERRDSKGRLFEQITPTELETLFAKRSMRLDKRWDNKDSLGREGVSWATMLFVRS
jgi:SAM-dependent methyltransferase